MSDLTPADRLQPSLLDRLIDDEPDRTVESRDRRVMSMAQLRRAVLRDLEWLLNTSSRAERERFDAYAQAQSSVLNFGLPDLCGLTASGLPDSLVEGAIRRAIEAFEPRVLREGLSVRAIHTAASRPGPVIAIEIVGKLWGQPYPEALYLRTEIDLETGECRLSEASRG